MAAAWEAEPTLAGVRQRLCADLPMLAQIAEHEPARFDVLAQTVFDCAVFGQRHVAPQALALDQRLATDPGYFPWDLVQQAAPFRLLSLAIPRLVGGTGGLALLAGLALEELCTVCGGVGNIFGAHGLGVAPLLVSGSVAHWQTALRDVAEGERRGRPVLMATAITEPSAGTDVEEPHLLGQARLSMTATRVAGGYLLNGRKCFISNGSVATYVVVCCATDRARPLETWTAFLVHRDMKGFAVGRVEHKMGQRACPAAELTFEDCFVSDEHVVGAPGEGMQPGTLLMLAASRAPVGAIATGIARGAYEHCERWARRRIGGRRRIDEPRCQLALADMHGRIRVARWAYANAATSFDRALGKSLDSPALAGLGALPRFVQTSELLGRLLRSPLGQRARRALLGGNAVSDAVTQALADASLAKAFGADAAMFVTSTALDLMGVAPCPERCWVEKAYRDARLTQIYEGTNELNRLTYFAARIDATLHIDLPGSRGRGQSATGGDHGDAP